MLLVKYYSPVLFTIARQSIERKKQINFYQFELIWIEIREES